MVTGQLHMQIPQDMYGSTWNKDSVTVRETELGLWSEMGLDGSIELERLRHRPKVVPLHCNKWITRTNFSFPWDLWRGRLDCVGLSRVLKWT